jgi:hypothetical protein
MFWFTQRTALPKEGVLRACKGINENLYDNGQAKTPKTFRDWNYSRVAATDKGQAKMPETFKDWNYSRVAATVW